MDVKAFWKAIISKNNKTLHSYFSDDAVIRWHCTNEQFTVAEYICANCAYPGKWKGEIERLEEFDSKIIFVSKVKSEDETIICHVVKRPQRTSGERIKGGIVVRTDLIEKLREGNLRYLQADDGTLRRETAQNGQHPYAIVICCSDSRVIPERIFSASIGDLFVIRVAGNVLDRHQLGSIEYAAAHLGCRLVVMLGHTGCGAVAAALSGKAEGFTSFICDDILAAAGAVRDPDEACRLNVRHGVERIQREFAGHPEISDIDVLGAVYDIKDGAVEWL